MAKVSALAAFVGAIATVIWGASMGEAVQASVSGAAALVIAISIHEHHATIRNTNNAAVAAGAQELARLPSATPGSSPPNV